MDMLKKMLLGIFLAPVLMYADTGTTSCSLSNCFNSCTTSLCNTSCENSCYCPTVLIKRPTNDNTVIYYGLRYQHNYAIDRTNGGFMFAFEYQNSFDSIKLARGLFGSNVLRFAGSQVVDPAPISLLADNFGLSPFFQGYMVLKPIIRDYNIHFDGYLSFDHCVQGLNIQLDANFEYQTRQLQTDCSCTINNTSTVLFPAGYMSVSTAPVTPVENIKTALALQTTFGDKRAPTTFGRFDFCDRAQAGIAAISLNLGYDFIRCDHYFLGAFFRVVAPTGTPVKPCFVFDPIVGNGKGWELGAGISSRWEMWNGSDCQKLTAMLDGYVVSILNHRSLRTFDFASTNTALRVNYNCNTCSNSCNPVSSTQVCSTGCSANTCSNNGDTSSRLGGYASSTSCDGCCTNCNAANCLTRYELLKQFNVIDGVYTYAGNLITASDFTTRSVEVHTPVKGDATLRVVYTNGGLDFGFGYNIFGMSREKITSVGAPSLCTTSGGVYAVKGCQCVAYDQYPVTVSSDSITISGEPTPIALLNSASNASAYYNGCGNGCGSVDNPVALPTFQIISGTEYFNAACTSNGGVLYPDETDVTSIESSPTYRSATASGDAATGSGIVALVGDPNELDICSGTAPRQFSNKAFISLDYTWEDHRWSPFVGFIAEVEGGTRNTDVAQWAVLIRGGAIF